MAKPITTIKKIEVSQEEKRKQNLLEIEQALADNKEAVLEGIACLRKLHDAGVLEIANALLARKDQVLENVVKEVSRKPNIDVLKNIVNLLMLLGTIDLEKLQVMTTRMNAGIQEAAASVNKEETTSFFQLLSALKDPDINRSITMLLHFLRGMGKS
ncbi:MAG: DUF1641 domain-containing protein [Bacillaceae bacterium]|mgnify:FL=1|jgi:Uncharacterized conserved protein|uniref:DUF1641 domain-containing protein n=2 Tax=Aeribacillus TaxID=1055323 RepID=A0A165Z652_9BACI|nr:MULTISPECIES: DUF1641 domain-containing protein [Aeribacillus]AXI39471.1 DUF1641 domain-containing protein [Bacillaceae bacterium ZC4]REJ14384.1 MAG: DUF1641 domain-containing protein [Bacillaceae bacterium]ASS90686.1 hypothetical protein AP3564_11050 [Aeribacillus pallidus]KZM53016.1 hypothetical protein A3Q35_03225 [Aeribacillus pallidus]KZN97891.1 hypothetical protein AZI98_00780 [Aeribacillus pallidus]